MDHRSPIVVLDSGLGGLTVVRALRQRSPGENILYFGDTARVPYGCKSAETVTLFVREIITYLKRYRPKHVVIACNTATALALPSIQEEFKHLPISGVIEPGARGAIAAASANLSPTIAVIATEATVKSTAYQQSILELRPNARVLISATPLLVPIIEEGRDENDPLVRLALAQYLEPLMREKPQVLVLGCTHYPIFKQMISRLMGPNCQVIDSAEQCVEDVARRLQLSGLLAKIDSTGSLQCFVTDDPGKFRSLASRFLGTPIDEPMRVLPEQLAIPLAPAASDQQIKIVRRRPLRAAI